MNLLMIFYFFKLFNLIVQAIAREDFVPGDKSKVCAMHFTLESYRETPTGENIFVIGSRIFLFFFSFQHI